MVIHSAIRRPAAVRKGCLVDLLELRGFMDEFVTQYWPGWHREAGERRRGTFLDQKLLNERLLRGEPLDEDAAEEASGSQGDEPPFGGRTSIVRFGGAASRLHCSELATHTDQRKVW